MSHQQTRPYASLLMMDETWRPQFVINGTVTEKGNFFRCKTYFDSIVNKLLNKESSTFFSEMASLKVTLEQSLSPVFRTVSQ